MRTATVTLTLAAAAAGGGFVANVLDYGAVGDGQTKDTAAFEAAVAAVAQQPGGGTLYAPPGTYLLTPFNLTSDLTVLLDANTTLLASDTFADWDIIAPLPSYGRGRDFPGPRYTSFLHGYNLTNVRITSNATDQASWGIVDGQGAAWWAAVRGGQLKITPGHLVEFLWSDTIEIDHVVFVDSPFWNLHPWSSNNIHIHDIMIRAPADSTNTDGVDPDSCSNVLLERLDIANGDDCVAIKSGWNQFGVNYGVPTNNVTVRDSVCSTNAGCVAIGSEMSGGVSNVVVSNFTCLRGGMGLVNVKSALGRGGYVRNITAIDSTICSGDAGVQAADTYTDQYPPAPVNTSLVPIIVGLYFVNLTAVTAPPPYAHFDDGRLGAFAYDCPISAAGKFVGLNVSYINGVSLQDVDFGAAAYGWSCQNVTGTSDNVTPAVCHQLQG